MSNHYNFVHLTLVFYILNYATCNTNFRISETENGQLLGERRGNYYAFEGVRFAAPPVGKNRFQSPQPYTEHWKGVRNSTKVGPACLQYNTLAPDKMRGEEDCLFGNIYTPAKKPSDGYKFPVIVHIHGGGFQTDDASFYGHELIMQKGRFVFASFNYRLGIFGFLSTESAAVPGNMGFKDQVMALKWVQRNIAAFDGDVDSITLTGFSAGAASVHLHYMSPLSYGLFHRGISHSGTATAIWVLTKEPLKKALFIAKQVGCLNSNQQSMIDCMRTLPAATLVRAASSLTGALGLEAFVPFAGVVEEQNEEAFITLKPVDYLKQRRIQKLPWLTSVVRDEGVFFTANLYSDDIIANINANWIPSSVLLVNINSTDPNILSLVADKVKAQFFENQPLSKDNFKQLTKIVSQRYLHCPMEESIRLQKKIAPVYSYFYNYKLHFGFGESLTKSNVNLGVCHGEDILLIYSTKIHAPPFAYTDEEKLMTGQLLKMYDTFAANGVPKFNNKCLTRSKDRFKYTVIDGPKKSKNCAAEPICDKFWTELSEELGNII